MIASLHQALHQHEPLIPSSLYEDFLARDPDYHALFQTVPRLNKRILSSLFAFFALVRSQPSPSALRTPHVSRCWLIFL